MRTIIVGGGVAAASAAATLRAEGDDGPIVLIGDETHVPYDRPPLSKSLLQGGDPDINARPDGFWASNDIELRLGVRVTAIDTDARIVDAGGERVPYHRLLIATGGRARALSVPGSDLDGIHLLRTVADARAIRADAERGGPACVIGMGFIGAEVAASLRRRGNEVVAISPALPLERVLGPEMGRAIARLHAGHDVDLRLGPSIESFEGAGRVERIRTTSGETIECDFVVAGVGIEVNAEPAAAAGIVTGNGIVVDAACRTSAPGVWAAGDVAEHAHPLFGRIRVEHWQNAIEMGAAAARSMLGKADAYDRVHWFWSDQYDTVIQYAGHHREAADVVFRGDPESQRFLAFYRDASGAVRAVAGIDRGREVRRAMPLIASGTPVDGAILADEDVDLKTIVSRRSL
ncbi:MAG TPA: FAD-dependent oxidoreductase [Actinomycetota bacterium]|nr:FAD-dependent oxidoreductase [Actinomycetota bacterium]